MFKVLLTIIIAVIILTSLKIGFEFIEKKILPNKTEKELDKDSQRFMIAVVVIGVFLFNVLR